MPGEGSYYQMSALLSLGVPSDSPILRDIAVYRRHNKHYILDPRMLSFDVLPPGCNSNHSHSTVPVETVVSLAAAANETAAQQSACALDSWKLPWRCELLLTPNGQERGIPSALSCMAAFCTHAKRICLCVHLLGSEIMDVGE